MRCISDYFTLGLLNSFHDRLVQRKKYNFYHCSFFNISQNTFLPLFHFVRLPQPLNRCVRRVNFSKILVCFIFQKILETAYPMHFLLLQLQFLLVCCCFCYIFLYLTSFEMIKFPKKHIKAVYVLLFRSDGYLITNIKVYAAFVYARVFPIISPVICAVSMEFCIFEHRTKKNYSHFQFSNISLFIHMFKGW